MSLQKTIERKQEEIANLRTAKTDITEEIESVRLEIDALKLLTQPKAKELYNGIDKYFTSQMVKEDYEHSYETFVKNQKLIKTETRNGNVLYVALNSSYFFTKRLKEIITNYCEDEFGFDAIKII